MSPVSCAHAGRLFRTHRWRLRTSWPHQSRRGGPAFMRGEETPPAVGRRVSVASPCPLRVSVFVVQNTQPAPVRACLTLAPSSRFVCVEHCSNPATAGSSYIVVRWTEEASAFHPDEG